MNTFSYPNSSLVLYNGTGTKMALHLEEVNILCRSGQGEILFVQYLLLMLPKDR